MQRPGSREEGDMRRPGHHVGRRHHCHDSSHRDAMDRGAAPGVREKVGAGGAGIGGGDGGGRRREPGRRSEAGGEGIWRPRLRAP